MVPPGDGSARPAVTAVKGWPTERRAAPRARPAGSLVALLGRTRAAVLATLASGHTTTRLADRLGISLAAASEHTAVLREAGLVASRRTGGAMLHTLTPLGSRLLQSGKPTNDRRMPPPARCAEE